MDRGRRKEEIFFDDQDREIFMETLEDCAVFFGLEVHAYSLMPEHYHLLVQFPRRKSFPRDKAISFAAITKYYDQADGEVKSREGCYRSPRKRKSF